MPWCRRGGSATAHTLLLHLELQSKLGIAKNVLSARLEKMVECGTLAGPGATFEEK